MQNYSWRNEASVVGGWRVSLWWIDGLPTTGGESLLFGRASPVIGAEALAIGGESLVRQQRVS